MEYSATDEIAFKVVEFFPDLYAEDFEFTGVVIRKDGTMTGTWCKRTNVSRVVLDASSYLKRLLDGTMTSAKFMDEFSDHPDEQVIRDAQGVEKGDLFLNQTRTLVLDMRDKTIRLYEAAEIEASRFDDHQQASVVIPLDVAKEVENRVILASRFQYAVIDGKREAEKRAAARLIERHMWRATQNYPVDAKAREQVKTVTKKKVDAAREAYESARARYHEKYDEYRLTEIAYALATEGEGKRA